MKVQRLRQRQEAFGRAGYREALAVIGEERADLVALVGCLTAVRSEAVAEFLDGRVASHREAACNNERLPRLAGGDPEADDAPLKDPERRRERRTLVSGADHYEMLHPLGSGRSECKRQHSSVRSADNRADLRDLSEVECTSECQRLVVCRDRVGTV